MGLWGSWKEKATDCASSLTERVLGCKNKGWQGESWAEAGSRFFFTIQKERVQRTEQALSWPS